MCHRMRHWLSWQNPLWVSVCYFWSMGPALLGAAWSIAVMTGMSPFVAIKTFDVLLRPFKLLAFAFRVSCLECSVFTARFGVASSV